MHLLTLPFTTDKLRELDGDEAIFAVVGQLTDCILGRPASVTTTVSRGCGRRPTSPKPCSTKPFANGTWSRFGSAALRT